MGSLIAAALARAQGFLLEPAGAEAAPAPPAMAPLGTAPAVSVVVTGLSRGSGATTVACALAGALVVPGTRPAHLISLGPGPGERPRAQPGVSVWELPPALNAPEEVADYGATLGRLASGGGSAAVVWDVRADAVARAARVIEDAAALVCVADGNAEPTLSSLVRDMLAERYGRVLLVANRIRDHEAWAGHCAAGIPDSRLAALLIGRGRTPGGAVGEAVVRAAALVEERG
jgi:hypothetical protein